MFADREDQCFVFLADEVFVREKQVRAQVKLGVSGSDACRSHDFLPMPVSPPW